MRCDTPSRPFHGVSFTNSFTNPVTVRGFREGLPQVAHGTNRTQIVLSAYDSYRAIGSHPDQELCDRSWLRPRPRSPADLFSRNRSRRRSRRSPDRCRMQSLRSSRMPPARVSLHRTSGQGRPARQQRPALPDGHRPPLISAARASVSSAILTCAASTSTPSTPTAPRPLASASRYAATLRSARAISSAVGA